MKNLRLPVDRKTERGDQKAPVLRRGWRSFTPPRQDTRIDIGPGTWLWNPFQRRGIAKDRAFILYGAWLADQLTPSILLAAKFGRDEIEALARWRRILTGMLKRLAGATLRCICRRGDP